MINQALAKNFDFTLYSDFAGYVSSLDKTKMNPGFLVLGSKNVYKNLAGNYANRCGMKRLGLADNTISGIPSEFVWNTSWGATLPLEITKGTLRVSFGGIYYPLLTGLTTTRYVFDKWWDNSEQRDRVLFVNGSSNLQHWSGGIAIVASASSNTITKQNSLISWQQSGFATITAGEKKVMINGIEYTYTGGESTDTLTGVTPNATGVTTGMIAIQSVITETNYYNTNFKIDFLKVINNQVYIGSYASRLCPISQNLNFKNYIVPTPRVAGSPELLTLDGSLKGIGVRQGNAHIGYGSGEWAVITFSDITVGTTLTQKTNVDVKPIAKLQAPLAHEFITTVGDSLIYIAQDNQLRQFGDTNDLFTPAYPSLSQGIATELAAENFTGGSIKCIGEFTYITAPLSGKTYLYQVRQYIDNDGVMKAERLWHSPMIWSITRVDEIGGIIYGYSNANPQVYQLWNTGQWYDDSPSGENLPYQSIAAFSYISNKKRVLLWSFDKNYTEGYIAPGTNLYMRMNYNFDGSLSKSIIEVNTTQYPAYLFQQTSSSLGDSSLGNKGLGVDSLNDGLLVASSIPKFKSINGLPINNIFEFQQVYYSMNGQWELLSVGTNVQFETDQDASFIINKLRK